MPPRTHHAAKRAPGCAAKPEADAARNDQITEDTEHAAEPILHSFTRGNARQPEKASQVGADPAGRSRGGAAAARRRRTDVHWH
jgi:hypothetical protein